MAFQLVYYAQNDPKWKDDKLGFGTGEKETIGYVGCALTSVAMMLSGHGHTETPKSLNEKLKKIKGFAGSGIVWWAVNQLYPQVRITSVIKCTDSPAPLEQINAALAAGQPAIVAVDSTAAPGYLSHYVMLIGRKGNDYIMLDPWPYQPDVNKETYLMPRYSHGNPLQRSIMQVVLYENVAADGIIQMPGNAAPSSSTSTSTSSTTGTRTPVTTASGPKARVKEDVTSGLNIRTSENTSSKANVVDAVRAGTLLTITEPNGWTKIGGINQWVRVRTPKGREGLAAGWHLEKVPGETYPPVDMDAAPTSTTDTAGTTSGSTAGKSKLVVQVRLSGVPVYGSPGRGKVVSTERSGAKLVVVEDASKATAKIGVPGKWLSVKSSTGKRGFVDAGSVRLV
jgi:hypothetical protein